MLIKAIMTKDTLATVINMKGIYKLQNLAHGSQKIGAECYNKLWNNLLSSGSEAWLPCSAAMHTAPCAGHAEVCKHWPTDHLGQCRGHFSNLVLNFLTMNDYLLISKDKLPVIFISRFLWFFCSSVHIIRCLYHSVYVVQSICNWFETHA